MVCGNFKESSSKRINLHDVEDGRFLKLVRLACGEDGIKAESVDELIDIGALAERLQMDAIRAHAENILLKQLKEGTCLELFQGSEANGLERLRTGCYEMLRDDFQTVSDQDGFEMLGEETMANLLEEDELGAEREEFVFEALVRWMESRGEEYRGERLLKKVRFGVINEEYLANDVSSALSRHGTLKNLVGESLAKKRGGEVGAGWDGVDRLFGKWMVPRITKDRVIGSDILMGPQYVATDSRGRILVSDNRLHQVIVFSRGGSVVRCIGSRGKAAGQFIQPTGVAVDRQGRIVVADSANNRIQVLDADGSVAHCFGSGGTAVGQLIFPDGVAIDREGNIVVADCENHRIQVFDVEGAVMRHFGSRGAAVGQFTRPRGVAVDGIGRIIVTDTGNDRVQIFNCDGSVALCFGSQGDGPGQFKRPHGVAVDKSVGQFMVADCGNHRIQVFDSDGSVVRLIDAAGTGAGRLSCPYGVAVGGNGRVVVIDGNHGRIELRLRIL